MIDAGAFLTSADGKGRHSKSLKVDDVLYFSVGIQKCAEGGKIYTGDLIRVGNNPAIEVVAVDYATNMLTLAKPITWNDNDNVSLEYNGLAPDIGAIEFDDNIRTLISAGRTTPRTSNR